MKLSPTTVNGLIDDLSLRLSGGRLVFYDGGASASFTEALVSIELRTPAFEPAVNGRAHVLPLGATKIQQSGQATRAQVFSANGTLMADLTVAEAGSDEARDADIVADRTDFSRDGLCQITGWTLRLPSGS